MIFNLIFIKNNNVDDYFSCTNWWFVGIWIIRKF